MKHVFRHPLPRALIAVGFCVSLTATADNRFSEQQGGMVGGAGSFSEGEITVFHNFIATLWAFLCSL